jgi:hypothetical protein
MKFSNVEWARYRGRRVLFDELAIREKAAGARSDGFKRYVPPSNLREAYQILKEQYRAGGDHVRSGDFHCGEMEMKRQEYSWFLRYMGLEALYYYLSGYGTQWMRAFLWLTFIVVGSAAVYLWLDPWAFSWNFGVALKFSVNTAALQHPALPQHVHSISHWVHVIESIWGPLQIALLALALRMRLKR